MLERFWEGLEVLLRRIGHVLLGTGMAPLADEAWLDFSGNEFFAGSDAAAMTVKACACFPKGKLASHCFGQVVGRDYLVARCNGEPIGAREVAHQAFIVVAISLEYPCLRAQPEDPFDWKGKRAGSIGNGVGALAIPGLYGVRIATDLGGQIRVCIQCGVQPLGLHRMPHGRGCIGSCDAFMAGRAVNGSARWLGMLGDGGMGRRQCAQQSHCG